MVPGAAATRLALGTGGFSLVHVVCPMAGPKKTEDGGDAWDDHSFYSGCSGTRKTSVWNIMHILYRRWVADCHHRMALESMLA